VDAGAIERVLRIADAQEAGGLFERFRAHAGHFLQRSAGLEGAVLVPERNNVRGQRFVEPGYPGEQRRGGCVHIHADGVHAVLDDGGERMRQGGLVNIMLVLADTDRFRLDLHKLRQRILQAPGNRHRAADGDIHVRKLLRGEFGGRINRRAGFRHHHAGEAEVRHLAFKFGDQLVGLPAGGAVADADELDLVRLREPGERHQGAGPVTLRLVRIDGVSVQHLAGRVHNSNLAARANARIDAHHGFRTRRRSKQQGFYVLGEDADRFTISALLHAGEEVVCARRRKAGFPGDLCRLREPGIGRTAFAGETGLVHHEADCRVRAISRMRNIEAELQHAFFLAA